MLWNLHNEIHSLCFWILALKPIWILLDLVWLCFTFDKINWPWWGKTIDPAQYSLYFDSTASASSQVRYNSSSKVMAREGRFLNWIIVNMKCHGKYQTIFTNFNILSVGYSIYDKIATTQPTTQNNFCRVVLLPEKKHV